MVILRQKVPLYTIPEKMIEQAARDCRCVIRTRVLPITERTGTIHVDWTVIAPA